MSSISKLNILGVRSFDEKGTGQNIEFKAPLTLIIGDNGSGKTTIIESLKYASTGTFPPGAEKGGAFIHDPKLTQSSDEVLAQVMMKFKNSQGLEYVASRRLSCTVKKGGAYTQKSLEQSISMKRNDEKQVITLIVDKMNKAVPQYMGVSAAILENVIFCHQDESLWPMSEPKNLKEKFDKIFEAEKYTKAIEILGKARTKHANEVKVLEVEEKNARENNNRSKKAQNKMEALGERIESKRAQLQALNSDIKSAQGAYQQKFQLFLEAERLVNEMDNKKQKKANVEYTLDELRANLKVMDEPTAWLESTLAEFDSKMAMFQQEANELRRQYDSINRQINDTREQLSIKERKKGQYTAEMKQHESNLRTRTELVKDAALDHSLRGYDGDLDEGMIQQFISRVESMNEAKDRELNRVKEATAEKAREHMASITKIQNRIAGRKQERTTAKNQIATNDNLIRNKQADMNLIRIDNSAKDTLEATLSQTEDRLKKAESAFAMAGWAKRLVSEKKSLAELEQEHERLRQELIQRTKTMMDSTALDLAREAVQKAQSSLDRLTNAYKDQLDNLVGHGWSPDNVEHKYDAALARHDVRVSNALKEKNKADRLDHDHSSGLQRLKSDLAKKSSEAESCSAALLQSIVLSDGKPITSVEEYFSELQILEKDREDAQKEFDSTSYISDYYKKALDVVNKKNCCSLCDRGFVNADEKRSATDKVNRLLERYIKENLEKELQVLTEDLQKAQKARPQYDIWKRLVEIEIPALKKDIWEMEKKSQSFQTHCDQQDERLSTTEGDKRDAKALEHTVREISKLSSEISVQNDKAARLSSQQKLSGSSLTIGEIEEQQSSCSENIKSAKAKIDKITVDRDDAKTEISDLEREVAIITAKVNSAEHELEKKNNLADSIKSLRDNSTQQRELIKSADKDVETLIPELDKENEQHEDVMRRGEDKARLLQADKTKLGVTVGKLKTIEQSIQEYLDSGGLSKLAACDQGITSLKEDLVRLQRELNEVTAQSNDNKDRLSDSDTTKRNIKDNIKYRRCLGELEKLESEIADLEARNTSSEFERLEREQKTAAAHTVELSAKANTLHIEMTTEDVQLQGLITEYETDYAGVAGKWQQYNVKFQTTRAIVEDLNLCTKALDNAIIAFHTRKMEDVNSIAAELWRNTYQGTDVDTIMIKSEPEKPSTTNKSSTRRVFNYRLVMVKGGVELDMRARCSAGQRVLACIIIRLALAESFGANCGVIALDEPTTNLDTDNIKALARSLHQIIHARKHQKNFQLIVITHDEAFIREMKCRDFTDEYYRVFRNADQNSQIKRQNLSLIDDD